MSLSISSITLNTPQLQDMLGFYGRLGFSFKTAKVDKGSEVHRATQNGLEFTLYSIETLQRSPVPSLQLGFKVAELEKIVEDLKSVPGVICVLETTEMPDGKKAIVLDPDGHAVELSQI